MGYIYIFSGVGDRSGLWSLFLDVKGSYPLVFIGRPGGTKILGILAGRRLSVSAVFLPWIFFEG